MSDPAPSSPVIQPDSQSYQDSSAQPETFEPQSDHEQVQDEEEEGQGMEEMNDQADLEEDLFGGEEDDEDSGGGEIMDDQDQDNDIKRRELEYDEDTETHQAPTRNLHIAEAPLPNLPFPKPSDGKHWDLRVPNFLSLNPLAFSDQEFLNEGNDPSDKDGENDGSKLFTDQNVIRWRWQKDSNGKPIKQSNTRVICWSDGSQSLQVGSELFDMVYTVDSRQPNNPASQQQSPGLTQGLTYIFAQHPDLKLLEAQASVTGQITLRPYSLNSLTHRIIVANRSIMKAHSQRQTQAKVTVFDPEKEKLERELEEERKLKEHKKLESKLARQNSRQANFLERGSASRGTGVRKRRFNAPLLSDEGEFDEGHGDEDEEEEEEYEEEMDENENMADDDDRKQGLAADDEEPALTELELADQRLEEQERERNKKAERSVSNSYSKPPPVSSEPKVTKRKLIIASDDDE